MRRNETAGLPQDRAWVTAAEWFAGRIDDREAIERMAGSFARLGDLWRASGAGRMMGEAAIEAPLADER